MSYDESLAVRIRAVLSDRDDVVEKRMFGGLCFMVGGAMCCGLTKSDFMVRVGPEQYENALAQPHARPMDFTGHPLKGMVYVAPDGLRTEAALARWVRRGLAFVSLLPAKKSPRNRSAAPSRSTDVEPRVAALMREFRSNPKVVLLIEEFGTNKRTEGSVEVGQHGLMVKGKLFARFTHGTLVVKLPEARVAELVAARVGTQCDPGRGRLRKWLEVTSTKASWIDLAKEAYAFVNGGRARVG